MANMSHIGVSNFVGELPRRSELPVYWSLGVTARGRLPPGGGNGTSYV